MARLLAVLALLAAAGAQAGTLRVALYNAELERRGPGLLLSDIRGGEDAQVAAVVEVIAAARPDVLVLQGVDYDHGDAALAALAARLKAAGIAYPHRFARRPNTGRATGLDLDGDGYRGGAGDAQGYGRFSGAGGMAVLSRRPIEADAARDFSAFLWADLPGATLPRHADGTPFPSAEAQAVQRLSDTAHWDVPIAVGPGPPLRLLTFHATPPVFDGPEDRNGLRNRDEARFWRLYLAGRIPGTDPPKRRFVVIGDANLDPADGDGRPDALRALLASPRLQDPAPTSAGAVAAAAQGGVNAGQTGDPALDTADWADDGAGNLRVDYVLPAADLAVADSGVMWPTPEAGDPTLATVTAASRHRLVWVDLRLPE